MRCNALHWYKTNISLKKINIVFFLLFFARSWMNIVGSRETHSERYANAQERAERRSIRSVQKIRSIRYSDELLSVAALVMCPSAKFELLFIAKIWNLYRYHLQRVRQLNRRETIRWTSCLESSSKEEKVKVKARLKFLLIVLHAVLSAIGMIMLSVCLSVCPWRCALSLNDTAYSISNGTSKR